MISRNLKDKNILIVGGSSGIGLSVAKLAFEAGARITLTSRDALRARQVASTIGESVLGVSIDVNSDSSITELFSSIDQVDHIYIAAGNTSLGSVTEGRLEEAMSAFNTRLLGSLRVVRAAYSKVNEYGSITFTGGVSTDRPIKGAWVSGLGTASAEQLARVLVMELPHIRFNAVSPGYTDTPMWDEILGGSKTELFANIAAGLPVRKIASPEEVAEAVIFLMSNNSVTGEIIHVDGGARLQ